jgi:hypothetical protein
MIVPSKAAASFQIEGYSGMANDSWGEGGRGEGSEGKGSILLGARVTLGGPTSGRGTPESQRSLSSWPANMLTCKHYVKTVLQSHMQGYVHASLLMCMHEMPTCLHECPPEGRTPLEFSKPNSRGF